METLLTGLFVKTFENPTYILVNIGSWQSNGDFMNVHNSDYILLN